MEPEVSELEVERNYLLRARRYLEKVTGGDAGLNGPARFTIGDGGDG